MIPRRLRPLAASPPADRSRPRPRKPGHGRHLHGHRRHPEGRHRLVEWHSAGFQRCSLLTLSGVCRDGDVARPTRFASSASALAGRRRRLLALDGAADDDHRVRPVSVGYKISRLHPRLHEGEPPQRDVPPQPKLHVIDDPDSGTATWSIPAGKEVFALFLETRTRTPTRTSGTTPWRITSMSLRCVTTPHPPSRRLRPAGVGRLAQPGAARVPDGAATDAGSGVASVELLDECGLRWTRHGEGAVGDRAGRHPTSPATSAGPADYGDGSHR